MSKRIPATLAFAAAAALSMPSASAQSLGSMREAARDATERRQWGELGAVCDRALALHGPAALFLYGRAYAAFMQGRGETRRADLEACASDPNHGEACVELLHRLGPDPRSEAPAAPSPAPSTVAVRAPSGRPQSFTAPSVQTVRRIALTRRDGPSAVAIVTLSLGGATLVASALLYAVHASETAGCDDRGICQSRAALERAEDARSLAVAGNVALGVGLAGVIAGSLWLALERAPEHSVNVAVGPDGASVQVGGRF